MSWIYWVTFFSFGYFTFHHILHQQYFHRTISKKTLEFAQILFPPIYLLILFFIKNSIILLLFVHVFLLSLEWAIIAYSFYKRICLFRSRVIIFLDEVILSLSLGCSLVNALVTLKDKNFFYSCLDFREIIDSFMLSPVPRENKILMPESHYLWSCLKEINDSRQQVRIKVVALRNRILLEQRLYEKTQIGLAQARAQFKVTLVLYLILIGVISVSKSSFLWSSSFLISIGLFVLGAYLLRRLSRVDDVIDDVVRISQELVYYIESGQGVSQALSLLSTKIKCMQFKSQFEIWMECLKRGLSTESVLSVLEKVSQRQLLNLLERGYRGESIAHILSQFSKEVLDQNMNRFEKQVALLPLRSLLPLLGFIFPAYLILIFVPLLIDMQQSLK